MDNAFIATTFDWDHRTPNDWQRRANKLLKKLKRHTRFAPAPPNMANVEARMNLFHLLEQTVANKIPGDVLDIGCNEGDSTIVMQKIVATLDPQKQVHAYDSFEGLPDLKDDDKKDGIYEKGNMKADLEPFKQRFDQLGLRRPNIHKGWFEDTIPSQLPERISFVLIDGDLYESTRHVLPHLYERMAPGAIGMISIYYDVTIFSRTDLFGGNRSPGVKRATDEFFRDKPEKVSLLYACEYSNGYFRKQ